MKKNITIVNHDGKQNIKYDARKNFSIKIGSTIIIIGMVIFFLLIRGNIFDSTEKKIIGTWENEHGFTYVFQESGQYSHDGGWFGTYSVDGNILTLCPVMNNVEIYTISITSNSLTLYEDGEILIELEKVGS